MFLVSLSCRREDGASDSWRPKTDKLDIMVEIDPQSWSHFAVELNVFYEALRRKDWAITYDYRTTSFKKAVRKSEYINYMKAAGGDWRLLNYEILDLTMYRGAQQGVRVVMEVSETPGQKSSISVVWWREEEGNWRCETAGPNGLLYFHNIRTVEKDHSP